MTVACTHIPEVVCDLCKVVYGINDFTLQNNVDSNIIFTLPDQTEVMRVNANGDFYVRGNLTINDMEIYQALKEFLHIGVVV